MKRAELFVFRHGETDWNREGRIQGHLDIPLNDRGRSQAQALIRTVSRLQIDSVLSSDLSRAHESARIVADALKTPVLKDSRLREIHLGKLQGMSKGEIIAQYGDRFSHQLRHTPLSDADIGELGAESLQDILKRSAEAIDHHLQETQSRRLLIVTHGGVLRRWIQSAIHDKSYPPPIPNCVIFPLQYEKQEWHWVDTLPLLT